MQTDRKRISLNTRSAHIYVVGDVHGCLSLYDALEKSIREDAARRDPNWPILVVFVGDVIDRGPDSAGMIARILSADAQGLGAQLKRLCLMGNHEDMFLKFLKAPDRNAPWLDFGGRETLASYGLYAGADGRYALSARRFEQSLQSLIPEEDRDWLESLPVSLRVPGYVICHAGLSVEHSLGAQRDADMMWGAPGDVDAVAPDCGLRAELAQAGLCIVHGHVPVETPDSHPWRINVDTHAYASGRLTAVRLQEGAEPSFISVGA